MAASKRFMNWTNVGGTPTGGTAQPITGVSSVKFDDGGSLAKFSGDGDRYNTTIVNDFNEPTMEIETADLAALRAFPVGTVGIWTATHNDAKNGIGTGAITYTFNGIVESNSAMGKHRAYGQGSLKIAGYSADGTTNPLSTSVAT